MTQQGSSSSTIFENHCLNEEKIPEYFTLSFKEIGVGKRAEVRVIFNESKQLGDIINDNSYENDFYRYHDVFHYSFATLLGWSPCARVMMRKKRKSNAIVDEVEDGARATITEEAISMIIFNEAKRKNYFEGVDKVSRTTLRFIKEMTQNFEVKVRTSKEWESAILKAYEIFRLLITNQGGLVEFDSINRRILYSKLLTEGHSCKVKN